MLKNLCIAVLKIYLLIISFLLICLLPASVFTVLFVFVPSSIALSLYLIYVVSSFIYNSIKNNL